MAVRTKETAGAATEVEKTSELGEITRRGFHRLSAAVALGAGAGEESRSFEIAQSPTVVTVRDVNLGSRWIGPNGLLFEFKQAEELRPGEQKLNKLSATHFAAAAVAAAMERGELTEVDKVAISFRKNGEEFVVPAAELLKVWQAENLNQIYRVVNVNRPLYLANLEMYRTSSAKATIEIKGDNIILTETTPPMTLRFIRASKGSRE
jgi:hypothetical protein